MRGEINPNGLKPSSEAFAARPWPRSLIIIRWIAVLGQLTAVCVVHFGLDRALNLAPLLWTIAAAAGANFLIAMRPRISEGSARAAGWLAFDTVQIGLLVSLTGGLANPFTIWLLAPVTLAGASLRPAHILLVSGAAILTLSVLTLWPLGPSPIGVEIQGGLHEFGLWFACVLAIVFISGYLRRIAIDRDRSAQALAAAEAALSREMRLSALGGLAAAAAHELGTPLATIQTSAKELCAPDVSDDARREDAALIVEQAQRCREILGRLSKRGDSEDAVHQAMPLEAIIEEVATPFSRVGKSIELSCTGEDDTPPPLIERRSEILYGLKNLVENASQFAEDTVQIQGFWSREDVRIVVADDGPGFPNEILTRIGEPYVTRRGGRRKAGGLGLGVFIARTLLERSGGKTHFDNGPSGARVTVVWPRAAIETTRKRSDGLRAA